MGVGVGQGVSDGTTVSVGVDVCISGMADDRIADGDGSVTVGVADGEHPCKKRIETNPGRSNLWITEIFDEGCGVLFILCNAFVNVPDKINETSIRIP